MRRLGLAVAGTAWIVGAVVGWAWFGTTIHDSVSSGVYWLFSWIPTCFVIAAPFVIYGLSDER